MELNRFVLRSALGALTLLALSGDAAAQRDTRWGDTGAAVEFTPRRTRDYSATRPDGYCIIRLMVDDEVYVYIRGDRVRAERTRGQIPRDDGSECSAPLPTGPAIANFRWRGVDGRGEQRLIEEPGPRNRFTAIAYIRDSKGGEEGYTFRIEWENRGPGFQGGGNQGGGGWGGQGGSGWGGSGWGGAGAIDLNQDSSGRGAAQLAGDPDNRLSGIRLDMRSSGELTLRFGGDTDIAAEGRVDRRNGDDFNFTISRINGRNASGNGTLTLRGRRLQRVSLSGVLNGRNYRIDFDARN